MYIFFFFGISIFDERTWQPLNWKSSILTSWHYLGLIFEAVGCRRQVNWRLLQYLISRRFLDGNLKNLTLFEWWATHALCWKLSKSSWFNLLSPEHIGLRSNCWGLILSLSLRPWSLMMPWGLKVETMRPSHMKSFNLFTSKNSIEIKK